MKKLFTYLLISILLIPSLIVNAQETLSIDDYDYNENTAVFTVSGVSIYDEVMVSLFDGDDLLSFKTVSANNGSYTATFNINFEEDKTITIKVGDTDSTEYRMTTLDVEETKPSSILCDDANNCLEILEDGKTFGIGDYLEIEMITDFSGLNQEEAALFQAIQNSLGNNRQLFAVMIINVYNSNNDRIDLEELSNGYKLFIDQPESALDGLNRPCMARMINEQDFIFEEEREITFSSNDNGLVATIDNAGDYFLYDDTNEYYDFLDNTNDQTYTQSKDDTLTLKIDADSNELIAVYIDNRLVDEENYTVEEGSTIITFKKDYLNTLSVGVHNVRIVYTNGEANTTLTIASQNNNPFTYDEIYKWLIILTISSIGLVFGITKLKKVKS